MAATYKDMNELRQNLTFVGRVRSAMMLGCIAVANEGWTVPFHRERATYVSQILNAPDNYVSLLAGTVATDAAVIADATAGGTVPVTAANSDTQQALVTDAHIVAALANQFNAFFRVPA